MPAFRGQVLSSVLFYEDMVKRRSADELDILSHVKRFLEVFTGDRSFRDTMAQDPNKRQGLADARGLRIEVRKLWRPREADSEEPVDRDLSDLPLAILWKDWIKDLRTFRKKIREDGYSPKAPPAYNAWRNRQVERIIREIGPTRADGIVHPVMAFELSAGCTVGCWFCGFGANPFQGYFERTPANVKLWREVLGVASDIFGEAIQTSCCYSATEPFDNPNYLDFLQDYREMVGTLPQTTSAAPLRDLVWTKRLMEMHKVPHCFPSRFSIISKKVLKELHRTFSPRELLLYELLMQHGESSYPKVRAGKALSRKNSAGHKATGLSVADESTTIACVSGFYVNMTKRSIQLVSPCQASELWPFGYRVHLKGSFSNAQEFGDFIERAVSECMPVDIPNDRPVFFGECFKYELKDDGFCLSSKFSIQRVQGSPHIRRLGDMIAMGSYNQSELIEILLDSEADIFELKGTLKDLFEKGLLEFA